MSQYLSAALAFSFIACGGDGPTTPNVPIASSVSNLPATTTTTAPVPTTQDCRADNVGSLTIFNDSNNSDLIIVVNEGLDDIDLVHPFMDLSVEAKGSVTVLFRSGPYSVLWVRGSRTNGTIYRERIAIFACAGVTVHLGTLPQTDPVAGPFEPPGDSVPTPTPGPPTPTPPGPAPPTPTPPGGPSAAFGPGIHLVGTEIAAGRYFSDPRSNCYWQRLSGLGGTLSDIIANDFIGFDSRQEIVAIRESDLAFEGDGDCGDWFTTPRHGTQTNIQGGRWLVGTQVASGVYVAQTSRGCYWERLRDFTGRISGIIANDFVADGGRQLVAIKAGDLGFSTTDDCGTWTRMETLTSEGQLQVTRTDQSMEDIKKNWEMNRESDPVR